MLAVDPWFREAIGNDQPESGVILNGKRQTSIAECARAGKRLWTCDTENMQSPLKAPSASTDPKSVKVNLTAGTGVEIEWRDGHRSSYSFPFLRDACPCAFCEEERGKSGRAPGDPQKLPPGALPMFKPTARPLSAEGVGKYAIKFNWNDGHELGIYSWALLREWCPCAECKAERAKAD